MGFEIHFKRLRIKITLHKVRSHVFKPELEGNMWKLIFVVMMVLSTSCAKNPAISDAEAKNKNEKMKILNLMDAAFEKHDELSTIPDEFLVILEPGSSQVEMMITAQKLKVELMEHRQIGVLNVFKFKVNGKLSTVNETVDEFRYLSPFSNVIPGYSGVKYSVKSI